MTTFRLFCGREVGHRFDDAQAFHRFSVTDYRRFWSLFLAWSGVLYDGVAEPVCTSDDCEHATFFPNVRLNYAENLLRIDGGWGELPALTAVDGAGRRVRMSRQTLRTRVVAVARALEALGIEAGDTIAAVVENDERTVIAALGAAAVGACFSTASPEMGVFATLERFAQIGPAFLVCHRRLHAGDDEASGRIEAIARGLPTLRGVLVLDDDAGTEAPLDVPTYRLAELEAAHATDDRSYAWRRFPFNQPLFTLFSSGTTGKPKCIQHGAGGALLEHLKEHRLHVDLRPGDKLFFQTSCAWMMWNWQMSALASGAEIATNAGPVRGAETLWRIVAGEEVTVFGTSPAYLQMCESADYHPRGDDDLHALRAILSTGSILYDPQFDWLRREVGPLPIQSISGGTDILGCFVLGDPTLPVHRGEAQTRSLGLDVDALLEDGTSAPRGTIGELVCRGPFPSRPLGFVGDVDGSRFHAAYFADNEGMWTHGDRIEISPDGGARLHGRSDGILNVNGIRIGPAEIYRILQELPEIAESLAVEQTISVTPKHGRLALLVVVHEGATLDGELKRRIRRELGSRGSPAHVPERIVAVSALPTTYSGKRSERAARDAVNGVDAPNRDALRNPESLDEIRRAFAAEEEQEVLVANGLPSLEDVVTRACERLLDIAPLRPEDDFFDLGGTSILAARLVATLGAATGWEAPPSTLLETRTIAAITEAIRVSATDSVARVAPLKPGDGRPVFLVHGLAGDVLELRVLARAMETPRPIFGLRARGLDAKEPPYATVEEMAIDYVEHVRSAQPTGPYAIVGYSFGGLVAFEMARRLRAEGDEVDFLGLLDTNVDDACFPPLERFRYAALRKIHRAMKHRDEPRGRAARVARATLQEWLERRLRATVSEVPQPWRDEDLTEAMRTVARAALSAFCRYRPKAYAGRVTYFRALERGPDFNDPLPVWQHAGGAGLATCEVPGNHFTMIRDPHVGAVARQIDARLGATDSASDRAGSEPRPLT